MHTSTSSPFQYLQCTQSESLLRPGLLFNRILFRIQANVWLIRIMISRQTGGRSRVEKLSLRAVILEPDMTMSRRRRQFVLTTNVVVGYSKNMEHGSLDSWITGFGKYGLLIIALHRLDETPGMSPALPYILGSKG
jgi:hypothetical protein